MQIIRDARNSKLYKTKYNIENDYLRMLHSLPFIKSGAMTTEESLSYTKCLEKWPFIKIVGKCDGRLSSIKKLDYFTWLVVI